MATTVFSFVGMVFLGGLFLIGVVTSWVKPESVNADFGRNIIICLMCAVLCAYLGGW